MSLQSIQGDRGKTPSGPTDGDELETRLTRLETRIDTLLPTFATKGDVSDAKSDIIKWLAGIAFAIVTIIIAVMAFMFNRAIPPQQMAPIVIYSQPAQQSSPLTSQSPPASTRGR